MSSKFFDTLKGTESEPANTRWVHLVEMNGDTLQGKTVLTCALTNGIVTFDGDAVLIEQLQTGIQTPQGLVLPRDGEVFLQVLSQHFSTPYLFATEPESGERVTPYKTVPLKEL